MSDTEQRPTPTVITYGLGESFGSLELHADGTAYLHIMTEHEDTELKITHDLLPEFRELVRHLENGGFSEK